MPFHTDRDRRRGGGPGLRFNLPTGGGGGFRASQIPTGSAAPLPVGGTTAPGAGGSGKFAFGGAVIGGLAGFLSEAANRQAKERSRSRSREALSGFRYNPFTKQFEPFESPHKAAQQSALAAFLSGELTPQQLTAIDFQRQQGRAGQDVRAAARGTPSGGQAALDVQLERDIGLGAAQLSAEQQRFGLGSSLSFDQFQAGQQQKAFEFSLGEWIRQQNAELERRRLLAEVG